MRRILTLSTAALLAALLLLPAGAGAAEREPVARMSAGTSGVEWQPVATRYESLTLTVSTPDGQVIRREFRAGETPSFSAFDAAGKARPDGAYTYELRLAPVVEPGVRERLRAYRETGDRAILAELRRAGKLPRGGAVQSGSFTLQGGSAVASDEPEPAGKPGLRTQTGKALTNVTANDQVIPDDLIVQGSACVGLDCVANESFGFDTLRLKENNTRIKFDDTSSTSGFPANDWQLTANDSASGGASKFSIEDVTGAKVPFTITAGASTNSIFVDSTGRVGFRTSTPVLDLHVATSNTPAMRLEQNNSGGFTAQTWDIAGNEANFFVRDVTGGSRLPLRIRPGAPTSSVDISASGDVGVGTASPSAALHVSRSTGAILEGIQLTNNNEARISIQNTGLASAPRYIMAVNNSGSGEYFISRDGGGGPIVEINQRSDAGSVASFKVTGSVQATNVTFTSSRDLKTGFEAIDPQEVLAKVAGLPISRWHFKEGAQDEHIGPVAEDFHAAFGLGPSDKVISVTDTSGVALAAVKGLLEKVETLQKQNAELSQRLEAMEKLLQEKQR